MTDNSSTLPTGRQTKIIATLGPASKTRDEISALIAAGANVFRINFSHSNHEDAKELIDLIRALEEETGRRLAVMADLQGPKFRIGDVPGDTMALKHGQKLRFTLKGEGDSLALPHPALFESLEEGMRLYFDDGRVRAAVTAAGQDWLEAEVRAGRALSSRKGVNLPDTVINLNGLMDKDRKDLLFAMEQGVDWVAQSFVQKPDDIAETKEIIAGRAGLMIKLEKPAALLCLDKLIAGSDAVMIARGDLGIEIPLEDVPATQKLIIRTANAAGKPVVVATQMLESMINASRPTRAEASDVATAIYDGADAIMLSAETASGSYPVRAVEMMDRIARRTETDPHYKTIMEEMRPEAFYGDSSDAISTAAFYVAGDIGAAAIVTYTMSGATALRAARQRPDIPILCLTPDLHIARRLCLAYGVRALYAPDDIDPDKLSHHTGHAGTLLNETGLAKKGDQFVMTAGVPFGISGTTNLLRIAIVG